MSAFRFGLMLGGVLVAGFFVGFFLKSFITPSGFQYVSFENMQTVSVSTPPSSFGGEGACAQ